jgi:5-deoxy-glucuronate isomerase
MIRYYHSSRKGRYALNLDPQKAEWKYISFKVVNLRPGEKLEADTGSEEVVFVPLVGRGTLSFAGKSYKLNRKDLFRDRPDIAYLPPRTTYTLEAIDAAEIAVGGAPAEGKLPARVISHDKIATAVRGGANAKRGVSTLADSDELTERLTVYEIHTPSGNWSSFPPSS